MNTEYIIKQKRSGRFYGWVIAIVTLLSLALFVSGYLVSQYRAGSVFQVQRENKDLQEALAETSKQVVQLQREIKLERETIKAMAAELRGQQDDHNRLQKELIMYKSVLDPDATEAGINIAHFEVRADNRANEYRYQLFLTQLKDHRQFVEGKLSMVLYGESNGEKKQFEFSDIAAIDAKSAKLKFKYIEEISGKIVMPEQFVPEGVRVIVATSGRKPVSITQEFPWAKRG